jgi:hypothetical protein
MGRESRYLQDRGTDLLNNNRAGEHGSKASFGGYLISLGFVSIWDAKREGDEIASEIIKRNDRTDRGIGHSQGVRICLEGVYQAAKKCEEFSENGVECCRVEKSIKLVLAAPKTSSGYIDKIHKDVEEMRPSWGLDILIIYSSGDWLVPNSDLVPIPGDYDPTGYATKNFRMSDITVPFPGHSSGPMFGGDIEDVPLQGTMIEDEIRRFLKP